MRLHVIQHVPFEGAAAVADWAQERGHHLECGIALTEQYPSPTDVDFLVIMGGPMAADDEAGNPWLLPEKRFIAETIAAGKLVLGVCLGAQILAEVLGGTVRRNGYREIGWHAIGRTPTGAEEPLFSAWEDVEVVGQWHGDTFDLPLGIEPAWSSEACRNQAFVFDGRVVALQFHLEWDEQHLEALIAKCADELAEGGPWIMPAEQIVQDASGVMAHGRELLFSLLDAMAATGTGFAGDGAL
jgi:GMP synthase-like glutamine amidotransferase